VQTTMTVDGIVSSIHVIILTRVVFLVVLSLILPVSIFGTDQIPLVVPHENNANNSEIANLNSCVLDEVGLCRKKNDTSPSLGLPHEFDVNISEVSNLNTHGLVNLKECIKDNYTGSCKPVPLNTVSVTQKHLNVYSAPFEPCVMKLPDQSNTHVDHSDSTHVMLVVV
jgi:hypothetical protein